LLNVNKSTARRIPAAHQDDPEAPEVAGLVVAVVLEDLRRRVLQGEARRLQQLIVWRFEAREAKVDDFDLGVLTVVREEQVLPRAIGARERERERERETAIMSLRSAKPVHSRVNSNWSRVLLSHVRVKLFLLFVLVEDCRVRITEAYDPVYVCVCMCVCMCARATSGLRSRCTTPTSCM